ncbi:MAG: alpha/beta hydrolase [Lysobacterales bacterium]|jgi:pimeloyl-ACP methyl ester carboxylesterase
MTTAREVRLDTPLGRLAGLGWRHDAAPRVLCLHGWLDSAASFMPLAPLIGPLDLVALDLPGHGHSEHRHSSTRYHFIDYVFNIDAALDALGWEDCHLLGHSMGASIASAYAAGMPGRTRSLVLLDALGPISAPADGTAKRLRRSMVKNRRGPGAQRNYDSIEEMVAARLTASTMTEEAARLLCERSARRVGAHYQWRSDPMLNWISALIMTDEQALDLIRHIEAPALTVFFEKVSRWISPERRKARQQALAHGRFELVEGGHHLHMEEPQRISGMIRQFILDNDRPAREGQQHEPSD